MTIAIPRLDRSTAAERGLTIADFLVPIRVGERINTRVRDVALVVAGRAAGVAAADGDAVHALERVPRAAGRRAVGNAARARWRHSDVPRDRIRAFGRANPPDRGLVAAGAAPGEDVGAVSVAIDSNDTRSRAESFMGEIFFRRL